MEKKKYWDNRHEDLYIELSTCTINKDKNEIIKELTPALNMMIKAILHRYFGSSYNPSTERSLLVDAITKVTHAAKNFDVTKKKKAFSFAQTIIKNHFHSVFIMKSRNNKLTDEALKNQATDISDDQNYNYVDHQPEFEIVSAIELSLGRLYSELKKLEKKKNEFDENVEYYYKRKAFQREPFKRTFSIQMVRTSINIYSSMIASLEEGFESYEGFIIDTFERTGMSQYTFFNHYKRLGFDYTGVHGILDGYHDDYVGNPSLFAPDPDYMDKDHVKRYEPRERARRYDKVRNDKKNKL